MDESLRDELEQCTKSQLVEIVGELVEGHSEIRPYLKLLLASRRGDPASLDPDEFESRLDEVFGRGHLGPNTDRYEATVQTARALRGFKEIADRRRDDGDLAGAARRYAILARRLADEYMSYHDSSGKLGGVWHDVLREVGQLFDALDDPSVREQVREDLEAVRGFEHREFSMGLSRHVEGIVGE
jgi:hypothetical protein